MLPVPSRLFGFSTGRLHHHPRWLHLFHLFVERAHQRQGIPRLLWERALRELCAPSSEGALTANSSLSAVAVYQAFGFAPAGALQSVHGISFLPMRRTALLA